MNFICLVYVDDTAFEGFSKEDHARFDKENLDYDRGLEKEGYYVNSAALAPTSDAVTVRKRNGIVSATDGPFAETKEHLGGFLVIAARDKEEAVEIARRDPMAAMGAIEVREMMNIGAPEWPEWAAAKFGDR